MVLFPAVKATYKVRETICLRHRSQFKLGQLKGTPSEAVHLTAYSVGVKKHLGPQQNPAWLQEIKGAFKKQNRDFPGGSDGKESACNAGSPNSISGSGRYLGEGNDNPLQYSCLEKSMDRGAHRGATSQTQLSH